jgi:flagellar protein FliS
MLYDRLLLDLDRAGDALAAGAPAREHLDHAQDVVAELMSTLDAAAWEGGERLMSIYSYVLSELLQAELTGDAERVAGCRGLLEPLALAWHEAADVLGRQGLPTQREEPASVGVLGVG